MVAVIQVNGLASNAKPGEIRRYFKENGVRPDDIHVAYPNGSRDGLAFLIFTDKREADAGLKADGALFLGRRINVRYSSPKEFNRLFPAVPMLSRKPVSSSPAHSPPAVSISVLKVDGLDPKTRKGEIHIFFKNRGVSVETVHINNDMGRNSHTRTAFLIFSSRVEAEAALNVNGAHLNNSKIFVRTSTPGEFNKHFPGVPMLQQQQSASTHNVLQANPGFKGVVKVDGINFSARPSDIRRHFRDQGSRPADIHFILGPNDKHQGTAFVSFTDKVDLEAALRADGTYLLARKLGIMPSTPKEFNRYFPSVDMISKTHLKETKGPDRSQESFPSRKGKRTRERSRSPLGNGGSDRDRPFKGSAYGTALPSREIQNVDPLSNIDQDKFIRMSGLPYDVGMTQIVNYFQPIPVREIYILKHADGKYSGQTSGSAIVEFFAKTTARKALQEHDGRTMSQRLISLRYASREDIGRALNVPIPSDVATQSLPSLVADFQSSAAGNNPQLQHLLTLLTATVSAMTNQQTNVEPVRRGERSDSVINRVANSANVDVTDIKRGCVIGLRNLPYSVTPDDILKFFHGFHVIADSVRIHYLDNGRCSGDAIISFRDNRDARNAVSALNRKSIGHRRVELFFL